MVIEYFLEWVETASVAKRTEAAHALARAFLRSDISVDEREDVEAALTTLLEDPSPCVRIALAETFGARKHAPRHIMSALADDVLDVSVITLSQSPVLHDTELVEIIKDSEVESQIAIACRPWISDSLATAISAHAHEDACMAVLMNPAANLSQENLHVIAQRFGANTSLRLLLLERKDIAAETRLILIDKLGDALSGLVASKGWMKQSRVEKVVSEACDKASISFVANASSEDVIHLVRNMLDSGKITVNYLLRAVCMGNITLVAHAFSELSGVKFSRVEAILTKDRNSAFKALYDRAGLPETAFSIFHTAISSWRRVLSSDIKINPARLPYLVTREVLETYSGQKDKVVDDLILLLRKLSAETARESSKIKAAEIASRNEIAEAIVEIQTDVNEVEMIDAVEPASDILIANFSKDMEEMQANLELEVQHSIANDENYIAVVPEIYEYEGSQAFEDDYRPDISEAIMNIAKCEVSISKAA